MGRQTVAAQECLLHLQEPEATTLLSENRDVVVLVRCAILRIMEVAFPGHGKLRHFDGCPVDALPEVA